MESNYIVEDPEFASNVVLYKTEAERRAELIDGVNYEVHMTMPRGEYFSGYTQVTFNLKEGISGLEE